MLLRWRASKRVCSCGLAILRSLPTTWNGFKSCRTWMKLSLEARANAKIATPSNPWENFRSGTTLYWVARFEPSTVRETSTTYFD